MPKTGQSAVLVRFFGYEWQKRPFYLSGHPQGLWGYERRKHRSNGNLLRKYIHGPRVDEPVCMIDVADSSAVYYYHFNGLGSVVALSDSNGDTVQSYEYSVYGQVAAEDPNHTNPYMFTGRRFDFETGLYYYRARYYNPYIGRFLQTDPVGYGAGMNLYAYCGNNPIGRVDPFGLFYTSIWIPTIAIVNDPDGPNAFNDVKWWFNDVGFFEDYPDWEIKGISIKDADFVISLWSEDDIDEPEIDYGCWEIGGATVIAFNNIGRLDSRDRTLDMIIKADVHRVNQWERPLLWNGLPRLMFNDDVQTKLIYECDSAFIKPRSPVEWRYKGSVYQRSEINYILEGHAMHHLKIPYVDAHVAVFYQKYINKKNDKVTSGVLYWFNKGWLGYWGRNDW